MKQMPFSIRKGYENLCTCISTTVTRDFKGNYEMDLNFFKNITYFIWFKLKNETCFKVCYFAL